MLKWKMYQNGIYLIGALFYILAVLNFSNSIIIERTYTHIIYLRKEFVMFLMCGMIFFLIGGVIHYAKETQTDHS